MSEQQNAWWSSLRHHGVLISPIVLDEWLSYGPVEVVDHQVDKLRRAYLRFQDDPDRLLGFLDAVLKDFLGHTQSGVWRKEQNIPERFKHQHLRPRRVLLNAGKEHQARFIVLVDKERVVKDDGTPWRLGIHGGRKTYADLLKLMRSTEVPLGELLWEPEGGAAGRLEAGVVLVARERIGGTGLTSGGYRAPFSERILLEFLAMDSDRGVPVIDALLMRSEIDMRRLWAAAHSFGVLPDVNALLAGCLDRLPRATADAYLEKLPQSVAHLIRRHR